MNNKIKRIEYPELIFGLVAPIGAEIPDSMSRLSDALKSCGYRIVELKVTSIFKQLHQKLPLAKQLVESPLERRYSTYIEYGDAVRDHFREDAFFAYTSVAQIMKARTETAAADPFPQRIAYIIRQFKRKEEIELLRSVYGRLFFQISIYTKRSARVDVLARKIANSHNSAEHNRYRAAAEQLVQDDENELINPHGQRVGDVFHEADFIVNTNSEIATVHDQIDKFVNLVFGSNTLSPTKMEYGLYSAKAASLRSLDLARQVGVAIFSSDGEVISLGSNEVPKGGGGTYWSDDPFDDRDYKRGVDSNYKRKMELLQELKGLFGVSAEEHNVFDETVGKSQFMDALEYGRMIHAEMSAICDAARLGRALKSSVLYSTTFPCHMCAKHIVAAGIEKVVFLEPYPKSLASELHSDSIQIEGQSREHYDRYPATRFVHFYGVSPRRYRDMFERGRRKSKDGTLQQWNNNVKQPIIDIAAPVYLQIETYAIQSILIPLLQSANLSLADFPDLDLGRVPSHPDSPFSSG